ncbi:hypothetical protein OBBRIDRAFT_830614 [Obba rivulosa]|uniref:Uncharacterized protein n=1 Tax=Obba rivulosa TaxID=1052685 RepID=A0A8E2J6W7_9APHY|nr:hypothetical protein OBBRIDRAFT_830614 [Obba rivulosa]
MSGRPTQGHLVPYIDVPPPLHLAIRLGATPKKPKPASKPQSKPVVIIPVSSDDISGARMQGEMNVDGVRGHQGADTGKPQKTEHPQKKVRTQASVPVEDPDEDGQRSVSVAKAEYITQQAELRRIHALGRPERMAQCRAAKASAKKAATSTVAPSVASTAPIAPPTPVAPSAPVAPPAPIARPAPVVPPPAPVTPAPIVPQLVPAGFL